MAAPIFIYCSKCGKVMGDIIEHWVVEHDFDIDKLIPELINK